MTAINQQLEPHRVRLAALALSAGEESRRRGSFAKSQRERLQILTKRLQHAEELEAGTSRRGLGGVAQRQLKSALPDLREGVPKVAAELRDHEALASRAKARADLLAAIGGAFHADSLTVRPRAEERQAALSAGYSPAHDANHERLWSKLKKAEDSAAAAWERIPGLIEAWRSARETAAELDVGAAGFGIDNELEVILADIDAAEVDAEAENEPTAA